MNNIYCRCVSRLFIQILEQSHISFNEQRIFEIYLGIYATYIYIYAILASLQRQRKEPDNNALGAKKWSDITGQIRFSLSQPVNKRLCVIYTVCTPTVSYKKIVDARPFSDKCSYIIQTNVTCTRIDLFTIDKKKKKLITRCCCKCKNGCLTSIRTI